MNIKRAFLTAAAVLMVPGFALAQDASFPVSVDFYPSDEGDEVTATITCNTGVPLTQDATISGTSGVEFVVTNVVGGDCEITMDGLDAGWEATNDSCEYLGVTDGAQSECVFVAEPVSFDFTVNLVWTATTEDGLDDVDPTGALTYGCNNVYTYGQTMTLVNYSFQTNVYPDDDSVELPGTFGADPAGTTECSASMTVADSAVEVDDSGCDAFDVDAGETDASCTITASVFFEGIPTLSQYGMAIMVLLMLGVGFVGFRRFV